MPTAPFNSVGERKTGALRVRTVFFGLASVIEEQIEDHWGTRFWRRLQFPQLLRGETKEDVR